MGSDVIGDANGVARSNKDMCLLSEQREDTRLQRSHAIPVQDPLTSVTANARTFRLLTVVGTAI